MEYRPAADTSGPPRRRAGPGTQRRRASCHSCRIGAQAMASAARTRGRQRWGGRRDERGAGESTSSRSWSGSGRTSGAGDSAGDIPAPEPDTSTFTAVRWRLISPTCIRATTSTTCPLVSHRRVLGSLVLTTKKAIRKLLAPILDRQVAYNAASTRVATHLTDGVEARGRSATRSALKSRALEARLRAEMLAAESASVRRLPRKLRSPAPTTRTCSRAKRA